MNKLDISHKTIVQTVIDHIRNKINYDNATLALRQIELYLEEAEKLLYGGNDDGE